MTICPVCKKQQTQYDFRPFCSKRCSDIDLAKWMNDSYAIPDDSYDADDSASELDIPQAQRPDPFK